MRSSIISQGCNVVCRSTPTRFRVHATHTESKKIWRTRNNITISLASSQCSLSPFALPTTCFSSTSFREPRTTPTESGSPPLSIIHPISTVSFHNVGAFCPRIREHTGVFTRIFGKSVKGYGREIRGFRGTLRSAPVLHLYLSLAL